MSCTRQRGGTILVEALTWWAQPRGGCRPAERKCWGSPGRMVTGSGGVVKGPHSGVWEASRVALWARLGVEPGDGASHVGVLLAEGSSSEAKRLTTCPLSCRRGCGVTVVAGEVMPMGRGVLLLHGEIWGADCWTLCLSPKLCCLGLTCSTAT